MSRHSRYNEYVVGGLMVYLFGSAAHALVQEQRDPTLSRGGWLIFFVPAVLGFTCTFYLTHAGAELVVDETGLTTRHRGWRLWPSRKRLRIRVPRHLPVHEIGRVEAVHDYRTDIGTFTGRFRDERIKMTCSLWSVFTETAIAVVQERPGLRRRLWLFDVDDPDPIAEALIRFRDTHNPGYLVRMAGEEQRAAQEAERRARIPNPTELDNSRLMPTPGGEVAHKSPRSFPGHREMIFEQLTLEAFQTSPPFPSVGKARFELTVAAIHSPTPFAELVGPAVHLIDADTEPDVTVQPQGGVRSGDAQLRQVPIGVPATVRPGPGRFRIYPTQTVTVHLRRVC